MEKVLFVIGATGGIGKLLAERLYKEGFKIVAVGRRENEMKLMKDEGIVEDYVVADITTSEGRDNIINHVKKYSEKYGRENLGIIFNQGILLEKEFDDERKIRNSFEVNIISNGILSYELKGFAKYLIYTASVSSFYSGSWDPWYQTTKAALWAFLSAILYQKDFENNRILAVFPDTIKTGEEGMAQKLKDYPKIPGDVFASKYSELIRDFIEKDRKYAFYLFLIENDKVNLYELEIDKELGRPYPQNKKLIEELGKAVY